MTRGQPDFGNMHYVTALKMSDLSVMWLGLTGFQPFYNTGRFFWADTFHNPLGAWVETLYGDATASQITEAKAYIPSRCVKLNVGTASGGGMSDLSRFCAVPNCKKFGIESVIYVYDGSKIGYSLFMDYTIEDGNSVFGQLFYDADYGELAIEDDKGFPVVAELPLTDVKDLWLHMKLVIDVENKRYHKAYLGSQVIDLTSYNLVSSGLHVTGALAHGVYALPYADIANQAGYVGYVLLSSDEI